MLWTGLRNHPLAGRAALAVLASALGTVAFGSLAEHGARAALSFVAGVFLAAGAFELGRFNIRLVRQMAPTMSLLMALLSYGLTTVLLALLLAASKPTAISHDAIASGLVVGVVIWTVGQLAEAWVVDEQL